MWISWINESIRCNDIEGTRQNNLVTSEEKGYNLYYKKWG